MNRAFLKIIMIILIAILYALFYLNCGQDKGSKIIRLIDMMRKRDIIKSAVIDNSTNGLNELPGKALKKNEANNNPFGIKRRLVIGENQIISIYAPPKSAYEFRLVLPKNSVFEFGYGVLNGDETNSNSGVKFVVKIKDLVKGKRYFSKAYTYDPNESLRMEKIDLSNLAGKKIKIKLETMGNGEAQAFWFNPIVYQRSKNNINIILISIDTLRADHLSCYGYKRITSEGIDNFAKDSVVFLNTYAPAPWTLPSHMSMFTSLYVHNHRVYDQKQVLDDSVITMAQLLHRRGYYCAAFTDGGLISGVFGFNRGFDLYQQSKSSQASMMSANKLYMNASHWIEQNKDKPFFLFLHTYQPHDPYFTPPPYNLKFIDEKAKLRNVNLKAYLGGAEFIHKPLSEAEKQNIIALYDAEIYYTDKILVSALITKLKKLNLYDRTMIIITSDHGEQFYEHSGWNHGYNLYQEVLKVPLIIKFPFGVYAGTKVSTAVSLVDIMPTIISVTNSMKKNLKLDGINLIDVIKKKKINRMIISDVSADIMFYHNPKRVCLINDSMKLIYNDKISNDDYAFFKYPPPVAPEIELYDLINDSYEKNNLVSVKKDIASSMLRNLLSFHSFDYLQKSLNIPTSEELNEQLRSLGYVK